MDRKTLDYYEAQIDVTQKIMNIGEKYLTGENSNYWAYAAFSEIMGYARQTNSEGYKEQEKILADMAEQARE